MSDSNHDIVPTLRMYDGVMMKLAADEIEVMREQIHALRDLLRSARAIAERFGCSSRQLECCNKSQQQEIAA